MHQPLQEDKESMPLLTKTKTVTNTKIAVALAFLGGALAFAGAALAARPDLAVQSVVFDPATRMPTVVIINRGNAAVPAVRAGQPLPSVAVQWLRADGTSFSDRADLSGGIPGLAPNRTQSYAWDARFGRVPSDAIRVRVTADFYRNVEESDENNNIWEGALPALPLPDLAVQAVTFDSATRVPTLVIINQGSRAVVWTDATPPQVSAQWLRADGTAFETPTFSGPISALAAGATQMLTFEATPPTDGVRLRFTLDSGVNRVTESNEANNVWEGTIPLPDLIPQSVTFNSTTHLPIVQVKNQGNFPAVWTAASQFQTTVQWLPALDDSRFAANTVLGTSTATAPSSGALAPNTIMTIGSFTSMRVGFAWADVRRARVIINAVRPGILESNVDNNTWEGDTPPPTDPLYYSLHPASPSGAQPPGVNEVLRFTVSTPATAGWDVPFPSATFMINSTDNNGVGTSGGDWNTWQASNETYGLRGTDFALYDVTDPSTPISGTWGLYFGGTQLLDDDSETALTPTKAILLFSSPILIPRGTSKTFALRMDTTGASSSSDDSLRIEIPVMGASGGLPLRGGAIIY